MMSENKEFDKVVFGSVKRPEQQKESEYEEAPQEVVDLANKLISERHSHLKQARILYLMYDNELEYRGKKIPGRVYKVHDREKVKLKKDLEIVISRPYWEMLAEENKQEAGMDFVLCFATIGSNPGAFTTQDPNFYGFYKNIDEFGMWDRDLKTLQKRMDMQKLPGMERGE